MDELRKTILDFVRREYLEDDDTEIDVHSPLISSGIVDSFSMVSLKTFIEKKYKLSILESRKTADTLSRFGVPVSALVVNRVLPSDADGAFLGARRDQEARYLQEIRDTFPELPRLTLPLRPRDVSGREAIADMAGLLRSSL